MFKALIASTLAVFATAEPVVLNSENFRSLVNDGAWNIAGENGKGWFVKFYAPWCGHCKKLAPTWDEFSEKHSDRVNVAKMDCTDEKNRPICSEYNVKGFPTLLYFPVEEGFNNQTFKYAKQRDMNGFLTFVNGGWKPVESQSQPDL